MRKVIVLTFCFFRLEGSISQQLIEVGKKLLHEHSYKQAVLEFEKALACKPTHAEIMEMGNNMLALGNIFFCGGDIPNAALVFKRLYELFPTSSTVAYNYGLTCHELADYKTAATLFEHSASLNQQSLDAQTMLASTLLALGNYEDGWQKYEIRWQKPEKKALQMPCPRWDGKSSLCGKTILLLNEGALGDCMQFIRYAQLVKEKGAIVIAQVPRPLQKLLSRCPYIDKLISPPESFNKIDYYASLMSLPALFKITQETAQCTIPYIWPDQKLIDHWRTILSCESVFKIGVCWQADVENDTQRPPLAQRSFSPELLQAVAQLPHVKLYSLQKNKDCPSFINHFGEDFDTINGSFMDSAAIIENLDLIITVDTSIAHLSGALGKPTWLILPFKADWRWMENSVFHSPFYPDMKIFRKEMNLSWQPVLDHIAFELSAKLSLEKQRNIQ
jgi:hypothetical protein